jgi:hypothetical protein
MGEDRYFVGGEERLKRASYQPNCQAVVEKSERNSEKITSGIFRFSESLFSSGQYLKSNNSSIQKT